MPKKVKSLFISDVHLGSRGSKAEDLLQVLSEYNPETLYTAEIGLKTTATW